jgi:hypothetical protein
MESAGVELECSWSVAGRVGGGMLYVDCDSEDCLSEGKGEADCDSAKYFLTSAIRLHQKV